MIDKTASSTSYRGGDGASVFPIPFPFLENTHITAVIRDGAGAVRILAAGIDFIVNRIPEDGGELVLLGPALPGDSVLHISRRVPLTQDIFFHNQGPNSPRAIEEAADKLTMIAQQLDADIGGRMPLPPGISPGQAQTLLETAAADIAAIGGRMNILDAALAGKADSRHGHAVADIAGLGESVGDKADARTVALALAKKADRSDLPGKSDIGHGHALADVAGLAAALAAKVDADDPRLDAPPGVPDAHAASHGKDGSDPLTPAAIGAMTPPPGDGKPYLAAGGGWIEYVAPGGSEGEEGIGTLDHSQLLNRDAAGQHPQSAIRELPRDLEALRAAVAGLEKADAALGAAVAAKADKNQLPAAATVAADGLMSARDKRRLDALHTAGGLPAGGIPDAVLARDSLDNAIWKTPAQLADSLPRMTATQAGVAGLAAAGGIRLDAAGRLELSVEPASLGYVDGRLDGLAVRANAAESRLDGVAGAVTRLDGRLDGLGGMSLAADAPGDGKPYVRQSGAWREMRTGAGGAIVGEIRLLPFRSCELPGGWYFCNGDRYGLDTAQGEALNSLPTHFKTDWKVTVSGSTINVPNLFSGANGYFLRPVDNAGRLPGSVQADAIRNITGSYSVSPLVGITLNGASTGSSVFNGAFRASTYTKTYGWNPFGLGANTVGDLEFDASLAVATADENRPANLGMTPAIHLGA